LRMQSLFFRFITHRKVAVSIIVATAGIWAALCLLPSCSKSNSETGRRSERPVPVRAAMAAAQSVPVEISTFGNVEPYSTVTIKSQVNGTITKVHFKKGQRVRKGDLLFTIDPRPFKAALDQAEANLARDRVGLENAKKDAQRIDALFKKGVSSEDELDKARTAAETFEATVRADQAAAERARLDLENCTIASPIDGRVGNILIDEGNLATANETTLVTINQTSPIQVFFSIPQVDLGEVKRYMARSVLKVQARTSEEPNEGQWGQLVFVDNAVDKSTGTIRLGANFENVDEQLWPGQYVLVALSLTTRDDAIVVPSEAIETGREGKYVYVIKADNTAELRPVAIGISSGDLIVIESGLKAGERIVTDGQLRLFDGAKVEIKPEKTAGGQGRSASPATTATSRANR
jgi:membrane fusion protein, multidrug efflux system